MDKDQLIEAHKNAAAALVAGQRLAAKVAARPRTGRERSRLVMDALGGSLANPAEFWSAASTIEARGDGTGVNALVLSNSYAAARLAAGDFGFIRESLLGQAGWCSVLAVKLAAEAAGEPQTDKATQLYKLSMQAQRQAAQALATVAALNRLADTEAVSITEN